MITNRFKILLAEKETRDRRNWSYREISRETGVAPNSLSDYARNRVQRFDAVTLDAMCTFFECSVGDLLVHTPEQGTPKQ